MIELKETEKRNTPHEKNQSKTKSEKKNTTKKATKKRKTKSRGFFTEQEIEQFMTENEIKYQICGAKTDAGTPCRKAAGAGTEHKGEGRCSLHGGLSTGAKDKTKLIGNKNAEKHGLFSKYLPTDTLEIITNLKEMDSLEMLKFNIELQMAKILRSQRIMNVMSAQDDIKLLKKQKTSTYEDGEIEEIEWEYHLAYERQARDISAQSLAMRTLVNMIKNYELLKRQDARDEEFELKMVKLNEEIKKLRGTGAEIEDLSDLFDWFNQDPKE